MGKPILYYATLSPPSRAVLLTAKAIGLELELRPISLFNAEHLSPEFIKMNPQHTIPTLDDNGTYIFDSHVISAYLVDKYAKDDKLYPKDLVKRAAVEARMYLDTASLFAQLRFLYAPILYRGSTELPEEKLQLVRNGYDLVEAFLKESPYLCGETVTIGDFCCAATICSIDEIVPLDKSKHSNVLAWLKRLEQLPYYKSVNLDGGKELQQIFREKLAENRQNSAQKS